MKIYINTSQGDKVIVGIDGEKIERESKIQRSQMLLSIISEELEKRGKKVADIKEIEVFLGPGSYTGLRVGVSVANSLAWSLNIPINGSKNMVEPSYE